MPHPREQLQIPSRCDKRGTAVAAWLVPREPCCSTADAIELEIARTRSMIPPIAAIAVATLSPNG